MLLCPHRATASASAPPTAFFAEHATIVFSGTVTNVDPVALGMEQGAASHSSKWIGCGKEASAGSSTSIRPIRAFERYPPRAGTRYLVFAYVAGEEERVDLKLAQRQAFVIGQCGGGRGGVSASASATNR